MLYSLWEKMNMPTIQEKENNSEEFLGRRQLIFLVSAVSGKQNSKLREQNSLPGF
jgi:hypothetical protein